MATAFVRKGGRFTAKLDETERHLVVALMQQTRDFLAPTTPIPTGDTFQDLVASFGWTASQPADQDLPTGPASRGTPAAGEVARDPALDRLLPPGHRDDEALAAEYRRLTEHGLRERKAGTLSAAVAALSGATKDHVSLTREQAQALVVALTDVRLLLGERLGLRTDEDADALSQHLHDVDDEDAALDPRFQLGLYYDFLTWLQESLAHALMPR